MLQEPVVDLNNNVVGNVNLDEKIFGQPVNEALLHEAVTLALNNQRQGTHSTKTRSFVSGGGKKPWKQKGSGRARSGSSRSPVWVGGGIVFGPHPRDYSYSMPRKKGRLALCSALASKLKDKNLTILDTFGIKDGKTREVVSLLRRLKVSGSTLIVCDSQNEMVYRGGRNLPGVAVMDVVQINVYDLLKYKNLVITKDGVEKVAEVWS
ncbi:MAG TPA: 50S ribosomal protein L4 [Nitrospirota bacterium]|nr:50S ribosomal protein L4 [Nitrospirota bacterium]